LAVGLVVNLCIGIDVGGGSRGYLDRVPQGDDLHKVGINALDGFEADLVGAGEGYESARHVERVRVDAISL
jgi:hypothetical protein